MPFHSTRYSQGARRTFRIGRPQRACGAASAAVLGECLWVIAHQRLTSDDYRYARCGREMWERPRPLAGYFTTCGNLNGDGTFAYRVAGFPLTVQRLLLLRPEITSASRRTASTAAAAQRLNLGGAPPDLDM